MNTLMLEFTLKSDATFGRGDGVAGLVDEEVQHDEYGLPFLNGRTLKGLLVEECADILFAITRAQPNQRERWERAAQGLFGNHGSRAEEMARMRVGDAHLPDDLRDAVAKDFRDNDKLKRFDMLEALTTIRRQTAMDPQTGAPLENTLRSSRVILRETIFQARLDFSDQPTQDELALIAACVKAFHHAGSGKTRGRGQLDATLVAQEQTRPVTNEYFARLQEAINL